MTSKYVATAVVVDPDTQLECEVEIRKLEDGFLVGLDASWLENEDGPACHPYNIRASIEIPDVEHDVSIVLLRRVPQS